MCRELTKRFEEVVRGTAAELAERFAEPPKGEITLVVGPAARARWTRTLRSRRSRSSSTPGLPRKHAAELVARLTGAARNRLYRGSL